MTTRLPATAVPLPLEAYAAEFDDLFADGQHASRVRGRRRAGAY